jgi:phage minor structural protein
MPTETKRSSSGDSITYKCEHVLATLLDDVMDGYFQYSGYTTTQILCSILTLQTTVRWTLGQVDFTKYFEYAFENENGLLAPVLSIPKPFDLPYEFTFDTSIYPWILNLKQASDDVKAEIRWGKDMIDFNKVSDPTDIVNYLIPKGTGEGINQLTIASVNSSIKYLKDDASIAEWGKRSYIWIDKSYENAQLLKDSALSLLNQWKDPKISFTVSSADLSILPEYAQERKVLNGVTRIIVEDEEYTARIVGEDIKDITKEYDVNYQINNKISDIATTQTDIVRKQQVNEAYSQGATNIFSYAFQENCDTAHPAIIPILIDEDVKNVNTCELTFSTKKYRGYTFTAETASSQYTSTSATVSTTPNTHSHNVTIPGHTHAVNLGIVEFDAMPTSINIKVDGNSVPGSTLSRERINLVDYLAKTNGMVTRGRHEITITPIGIPNGVARIEAYVILRVFIQSRIGGVY